MQCSRYCCKYIKQNLLLFFILLGVSAGITLGICLRLYVPAFQEPDLHPREVQYLYFPAEIFLRMMLFITLPLLVSSLVSGIGSLSSRSSRRVGLYAFSYYILSTTLAVVEGFIFVYAIKPGGNAHSSNLTNVKLQQISIDAASRIDSFMDMIRNMFPDNIIASAFQMHKTKISYEDIMLPSGNGSTQVPQFDRVKVDTINILGVTIFCIIFSVALTYTKSRGRALFAVFENVLEAVMQILNVILWVYPIAIMFMLASTMVQIRNPVDVLQEASMFILTALSGLLTHFFIVLPLVYLVLTRKNPYRFMVGCLRALVTAFATGNSTMTLPMTMACMKRLGFKDSIISFMAPLGTQINMDGTALYQAIAPIFVATLHGMNPGATQVVALGVTAVVVSIGAPSAFTSMTLYVIMFKTIGLPLNDIGLLLTFDWIMARFRCIVNIFGDCVGIAVVHKLYPAKSRDVDAPEPELEADESEVINLKKQDKV